MARILLLFGVATIFSLVSANSAAASEEGIDTVKGKYQINSICVMANALRLDPVNYLRKYGDQSTANSCAAGQRPIGPVYMSVGLCRASEFHAASMAAHNQMTHNTLGDLNAFGGRGDFATRINRFFTKSRTVGENVAKGTLYDDPIKLNNAWIASPAHCKNLMDRKYNAVGGGATKANEFFAAQTFATLPQTPRFQILCGSHIIHNGHIFFMCAVDKCRTPPMLIINDQRIPMHLDLGIPERGVYKAVIPQLQQSCNQYLFEAGNERFPRCGYLLTEGWGSCRARGSGVNQQRVAPQ